MRTVRDLLQDADPLRDQPSSGAGNRARLRQAIVAATSAVAPPAAEWRRTSVALLVTAALIIGIVTATSRTWLQGGGTLQAAIRFEVRLAEDRPGAGLRELRLTGSDRTIYLHQEAIVTNSDIVASRVVPEGAAAGSGTSRFNIEVQFNPEGAEKMREATAGHIGRPVAILIDGEVVMAPVLRARITTTALITGDYTKAEAEMIVTGIGIR